MLIKLSRIRCTLRGGSPLRFAPLSRKVLWNSSRRARGLWGLRSSHAAAACHHFLSRVWLNRGLLLRQQCQLSRIVATATLDSGEIFHWAELANPNLHSSRRGGCTWWFFGRAAVVLAGSTPQGPTPPRVPALNPASQFSALGVLMPQIFQLRFYRLSRRLIKIMRNARKYRRIFSFVPPHRREVALARYIRALFQFADGRTYGTRVAHTLAEACANPQAPARAIYAKQQTGVLAAFLQKLGA